MKLGSCSGADDASQGRIEHLLKAGALPQNAPAHKPPTELIVSPKHFQLQVRQGAASFVVTQLELLTLGHEEGQTSAVLRSHAFAPWPQGSHFAGPSGVTAACVEANCTVAAGKLCTFAVVLGAI